MSRQPRSDDQLLLGEWACLGLVCESPRHGFALASELRPEGEVGRVWSISRPLTYRAVDQLVGRGFIEIRGDEPGAAGGSRTIYGATRRGRAAFRNWVVEPVEHLRDLRSELLLKLVLTHRCGFDSAGLVDRQKRMVVAVRDGLVARLDETPDDLVIRWRLRSAEGALRFLDDLSTD